MRIPLAPGFWKTLCKIGNICPSHVWKNYSVKICRPGVFFLGRIVGIDRISLTDVRTFRFSVSSCDSFGKLCLAILPFHLYFQPYQYIDLFIISSQEQL